MPYYSLETKKELLKKDNKCPYCSREMSLGKKINDNAYPTFDHIVPKHEGGRNTEENLLLCCCECNARKGKIDLLAYLIYITDYKPWTHKLYKRVPKERRATFEKDLKTTKTKLTILSILATTVVSTTVCFIF